MTTTIVNTSSAAKITIEETGTTTRTPRSRRPVTTEMAAEWVVLWREGATFKDIGQEYDYSTFNTAYNIYKYCYYELLREVRRLQDVNDKLMKENKRLRAMNKELEG